jgi:hypothetical protein
MPPHEGFERHEELEQASNRSFGLVFTVFFALIAFFPLIKGRPVRLWAVALSALFLSATLIRPEVLEPLNRLWMGLSLQLSKVTNTIVLGLLYFLVFSSIGLTWKLRGKDSLRLRYDPTADSYWIPRVPPGPEPESMVRQF